MVSTADVEAGVVAVPAVVMTNIAVSKIPVERPEFVSAEVVPSVVVSTEVVPRVVLSTEVAPRVVVFAEVEPSVVISVKEVV